MVNIKTISRDVTLCGRAKVHAFCLHLQRRRLSQASKEFCSLPTFCWFLAWLILSRWKLRQHLFLNVIMQVWRNCLVLSEQKSDSSAFINAMGLLKYVLNSEEHFLYFDPDYPTSGLTVTGLARVYFTFLRNLGDFLLNFAAPNLRTWHSSLLPLWKPQIRELIYFFNLYIILSLPSSSSSTPPHSLIPSLLWPVEHIVTCMTDWL
jgi:hypothetical protein